MQVESAIFPADSGGAEKMADEMSVPLLGHLPVDPLLARCCDEGRDYLSETPDSSTVRALTEIVQSKIHTLLSKLKLQGQRNYLHMT